MVVFSDKKSLAEWVMFSDKKSLAEWWCLVIRRAWQNGGV